MPYDVMLLWMLMLPVFHVCCVDPRVNAYAIFIAGESNAESLIKSLPIGHGYVCQDTAQLPKIFKEIFTSSLLRNPTGPAQL